MQIRNEYKLLFWDLFRICDVEGSPSYLSFLMLQEEFHSLNRSHNIELILNIKVECLFQNRFPVRIGSFPYSDFGLQNTQKAILCSCYCSPLRSKEHWRQDNDVFLACALLDSKNSFTKVITFWIAMMVLRFNKHDLWPNLEVKVLTNWSNANIKLDWQKIVRYAWGHVSNSAPPSPTHSAPSD